MPPVLFLIFNRPDLTKVTFERIRKARPTRLYIHADGPRATREQDAALCTATRAITENIDWPCDVRRLFRTENLGCGPAVSAALDWFFSEVEEGIVLEDDCAPLPGFFAFCETMLDRYRADPLVMHVSGMGFQWKGIPKNSAAFLSPMPFIWGWASWRRAWNHYRFTLPPAEEIEPVLSRECPNDTLRTYWRSKFDGTRAGAIRTWDYQWVYTLWSLRASAVTPTRSLIENLGFGADSTHTVQAAVGYAPPLTTTPACRPVATPPRRLTLKEIDRKIFSATPLKFDDLFRKPAWLWRAYLALRNRTWARTVARSP